LHSNSDIKDRLIAGFIPDSEKKSVFKGKTKKKKAQSDIYATLSPVIKD